MRPGIEARQVSNFGWYFIKPCIERGWCIGLLNQVNLARDSINFSKWNIPIPHK